MRAAPGELTPRSNLLLRARLWSVVQADGGVVAAAVMMPYPLALATLQRGLGGAPPYEQEVESDASVPILRGHPQHPPTPRNALAPVACGCRPP